MLLCSLYLITLTGCVSPSADPIPMNLNSESDPQTQGGVHGGQGGETAEEMDGRAVGGMHQESHREMGVDSTGAPPPPQIWIASYNVQNLFDLIDDPEHSEGEYTPSPNRWSSSVYQTRLDLIAQVIENIDADLLTLQEVESEVVLSDLVERIAQQGGPIYPYFDLSPSRDPRGISIAILSKYPLKRAIGRPINRSYRCANGEQLDGSRPEARPIYEVNIWGTDDRYSLTLLINHWKSKAADDRPCLVSEHQRRGGEQIQGLVEGWLDEDPDRAIIVLGDFNARETELSLTESLGASVNRQALRFPSDLYNVWGELGVGQAGVSDNATNSSYYFDQRWHRIDHIFVTRKMIEGGGLWSLNTFEVVRPAFLMNNGRPFSWNLDRQEGFSDHLPLKILLDYSP